MAKRLFADIPAEATISEISPLPSDPNVRRIRVGRRIVARLRVSDIERLGLRVGQEWTAEIAANVREAVELAKARKHAFAALGRRGLSQQELIERLMRREHDRAVAEQIAEELAADGWLDDAALARDVVQQIVERKPAAAPLLRQKLAARGIPGDVADRVVEQYITQQDPIEQAMELARKRQQSMHSLSAATASRRIAGTLHRRGFDDETISAVLDRLGFNEAE